MSPIWFKNAYCDGLEFDAWCQMWMPLFHVVQILINVAWDHASLVANFCPQHPGVSLSWSDFNGEV
jgi:hypothetical protein